eukprot:scaffold106184_cov45-Phaeocystis_antarctica.AAC.1
MHTSHRRTRATGLCTAAWPEGLKRACPADSTRLAPAGASTCSCVRWRWSEIERPPSSPPPASGAAVPLVMRGSAAVRGAAASARSRARPAARPTEKSGTCAASASVECGATAGATSACGT